MADPAVAAAMAAARALLSPGDPATLAAADAHLRAVNDSPDGWRIGRALLSAETQHGDVLAPRVRVMGAAMLRAKAHADGFAMTPPDAASMTSELLAMLGTPEGSGELGPHLAQIAAAVATAGGAETLASLVDASISLAAPDSNGGWARVQDPNAPVPCGPNAHAAVALLAACAEEALHRVKAHPPETTRAAQDLLDDVTWTLQAVACGGGDTSGGGGGVVVTDAARADVFRALRLWIPAGVTASELVVQRNALFTRLVDVAIGSHTAVFDPRVTLQAAETLHELCVVSDPLPGRAAAVDAVLRTLESAADACDVSAATRLDWNLSGGVFVPPGDGAGPRVHDEQLERERVRAHAWSVASVGGALGATEPRALATHGHGKIVRFLTDVVSRADAGCAAIALAAFRQPPPRGLVAHLRSPGGRLHAVFDALAERLAARTAGAAWRAFVGESASRLARERVSGGGHDANNDAVHLLPASSFETSLDDDGELAVVGDVEAAIGALHAAMGTPTFMRIAFDRLSKASGDPAVVAAELVMLADSGYPLAPDAPEDPTCVDIANVLVALPACDLAPVKALVARVFRGPFKRLLTSDPDSFSRALRYLLRGPSSGAGVVAGGSNMDERVACARACVQTIASLVEDVCVGGHDVVRSMRDGIDAVLDETRLLAPSDRGAFMKSMCHFHLAARDADAVNELASRRLARLTASASSLTVAAATAAVTDVEASHAASAAGELRVLRDWCESGARSVASPETIDAIWRASWRFAELAVARGGRSYGGVAFRCCELWRTLPLAQAVPSDADVATALGLVDRTLTMLSTRGFDADAFGHVVSVPAAFLEENVGDVDLATGLLNAALELLWREGEKVPVNARAHGRDDRFGHAPDAAAAAFNAMTTAATRSLSSVPAADACLRQAALLCRGHGVEPATSALKLIEHVWSRAPWADLRGEGDASPGVAGGLVRDAYQLGSLAMATCAGGAAAAAECANPALLEPIALALWSQSARCAEEGGENASAWLFGAIRAALVNGTGLSVPVESSAIRAGAVSESAVDAFAYAVAMRRPQHPARRVAELVDVFGRACRGHGPASALEEFR